MKRQSISFESLLDFETKSVAKKNLYSSILYLKGLPNSLYALDKRLDKLKRLILKSESDNELLFCIKMYNIITRKESLNDVSVIDDGCETDRKIKMIFESIRV